MNRYLAIDPERSIPGSMLLAMLATAALASLVTPAGARCQTPLVFVHGFLSNGTTWSTAAQRLESSYNVSASLPNLPSLDSYENQATSLIGQVSGVGGNAIAIGHSNGGLVARMANADGRSWAGIITVGTPHTGAPLAANTLNGQVFEEGRYIAGTVSAPFATYYQFYPDDWAWEIAGGFGRFAASIGDAMPYLAAAVGFGAQNTVLPEMAPGSAFLTETVNSGANLNRESAALPQRISIASTVIDAWGLFWHGVLPSNYQSLASAQYAAGDVFMFAGEYYENYDDYNDPYWYDKQANAFLWYDAAAAMYYLDQNWCALIGAADGYYACALNDGVLPTALEAYPNGTYSVTIAGPSHFEETGDDQVYTNIAQALTQRFGVGAGGGGGGGGVSSVTISGPTNEDGCASGEWSAQPTGGTAPYTYSWTVEGNTINTGTYDFLDYTNEDTGASIFIQVTVTDANQTSVQSSRYKVNLRRPGQC